MGDLVRVEDLRVQFQVHGGVIDARGVVRQHLGMSRQGRIDGKIPPAGSPTPFAILGNWMALVWAIALLGASLVVKRRRGV